MKIIALMVLFVLTVYGQSKYCCFPDQWEAIEGMLTGSVDQQGKSTITQGSFSLAYDALGERVFLRESVSFGNETKQFDILQLYRQNVQYIVEHNTTCTKIYLRSWNNRNCIPDNATKGSTYTLGLTHSLTVTDYSFTAGLLQSITAITDGCVPVYSKTFGQVGTTRFMTFAAIQDITLGIKNPSVFNVPSVCNKSVVNIIKIRHTADMIIEEKEQLIQSKPYLLAQYLIPSRLSQLSQVSEKYIFVAYNSDCVYDEKELKISRSKWSTTLDREKPASVCETLACMSTDTIPNSYTALTNLATIPVSVASAERFFSTL